MTYPDQEFERLFHANYDQLVSSLTAITGDRETARDCVQEAFIKAATRWRKIIRYEDPTTWVRRVAINKSRDLHRADERRRRRETRVTPVARTGSDQNCFGAVEDSTRLVELFKLLPPGQRQVAALYYINDLPVSEIAVNLALSPRTVRSHLNRARSMLRDFTFPPGTRSSEQQPAT